MKKVLSLAILSLMFFVGARSYAETPPANAEIGNQATLEYVSGTGESRTVLSNIVITTVNPVYGLTLTPDNSLTGVAGETVYFVHALKNIGNAEDTYDLAIQSQDPQYTNVTLYIPATTGLTPLTGPITLKAGETQTIMVGASSSGTGNVGDIIIRATSQNGTNLFDEATDDLTITTGPVIVGYKTYDISEGAAGEEITVTFSFFNRGGDIGQDILITDVLDDDFEYIPGNAFVAVSDYAGDGGVSQDYVAITEGGAAVDGVSLNVVGQTITLSKPDGMAIQSSTGTLDSANLKFRFKIKSKENLLAKTIPNVASFDYLNSSGAEPKTGKTNIALYTILQVANLTFEGEVLDEVEQGALIKFTNVLTNTGNADDTFDIELVDDEFPSGTSFFLSFDKEGNNDFSSRVPLIDTTGSGTIDSGVMAAGETKNIILWAQLPREAVGADLKINKLGTSNYDLEQEEPEGIEAKALDRVTTILPVEVDLTNNYSLIEKPTNAPGKGKGPEVTPVTQIEILPGNKGFFSLYVNNTSSFLTDEYVLEVSEDASFETISLPKGIDVTFQTAGGAEIVTTGAIEPQENMNVRAVVDVASNTLAGNISLFFRVRSLSTGAVDIKHDMVIIGILRNLSILPNNRGEVYAGSTIVYSHTITNGGNVTEGTAETSGAFVKLSDNKGAKFSSVAWHDVDNNGILDKGIDKQIADLATVGGLAPGESIGVFVEVAAALNAGVGTENTTTIKLDVTKGIYNVYHPDVKAEDVTKIIQDSITISKFQGTAPSTGFDPSNPANMTQDQQTASPEDYIYYRLLIENTGITTIEDVVVEDIIPQYTVMKYGDDETTPGVDSKPSWRIGIDGEGFAFAQTMPVEGGKGIIKAEIGSLEPGERAELYFNVQVEGSQTPTP